VERIVSDVVPGAVFGGRWRVERALSSGGMGSVFVAAHTETGRKVALKVVKTEQAHNAEFVARFQRETGALAAVSHPNVVTFLDSGVESGTLFLVMELLRGRPLRAALATPMEWRRAFTIAADVCRALAAVHKAGIVHRDLKPENIFLQEAEGIDEVAKLIDFGIARLQDTSLGPTAATTTGAVVGTPGYISPEQLKGEVASPASDVYAVGVILYEMVTGKFPFAAPTPHAMLVRQLMEPLAPPRSHIATVPAHVERVIMTLLEKEPAARPKSALDALATLLEAQKLDDSLAPSAMTEDGAAIAKLASQVLASSTAANASAPTPVTSTALPSTPASTPLGIVAANVMDAAGVVTARIVDANERKQRERELRQARRDARTPLERIVRFAGIVTLAAVFGGLGVCGTCVAGAESCGHGHGGRGGRGDGATRDEAEAEAKRAEAEAKRAEIQATRADDEAEAEAKRAEAEAKRADELEKAVGGVNVELTPSESTPGKGNIDVHLGSASLHLTGVDLERDAGPGGRKKLTFTTQRPSVADVKKLIDQNSAQLAECGARGSAPAKLTITLDCDGKFELETPVVGPAVACAAGLISTWSGPHFVGDSVTVDVEKPLGK
jgi:serine/threonine-protein kinase